MGFSKQEYWSGLPFLLQGIFPTQESNLGLLHCRQIIYWLSYEGSIEYHKSQNGGGTQRWRRNNSTWKVADQKGRLNVHKQSGDLCRSTVLGFWRHLPTRRLKKVEVGLTSKEIFKPLGWGRGRNWWLPDISQRKVKLSKPARGTASSRIWPGDLGERQDKRAG